jgi:hypothetical protein
MSTTKIYLVGNADAPKLNQWQAMTNNWLEAEKLLKEMGPTSTHKVVTVAPPRGKR